MSILSDLIELNFYWLALFKLNYIWLNYIWSHLSTLSVYAYLVKVEGINYTIIK